MIKQHTDSNGWPSSLPEEAVGIFGQGDVMDMAYSPDGQSLAVATSIGLWWYELSTMAPVDMWPTREMSGGIISTIAFSHNGEWVAIGGPDGNISVWEISSRICIVQMNRWDGQRRFNHQKEISRIAFSPNSQQLAVTGRRDYIIDIWHPETGEHLLKLNSECSLEIIRICSLRRPIIFSPDSQLLVGLSPDDPNNVAAPNGDIVSVWDLSTGLRIKTFREFAGFGQHFCFSGCGDFLAVGSNSESLKVLDTNDWKICHEEPTKRDTQMIPAYSSDNLLRIAEVSDTSVVLHDVHSHQTLSKFQVKDEITHTQFFKGTHLAVNSGLELKNWTLKSNELKSAHHTHVAFVQSLYFSPDSKLLAAGYRNDGLLLWNTNIPSRPQNIFNQFDRFHKVFGSSDGKIHTACVNANIIKVLDVETQTLVTQIKPEKPPSYWAFAFSPAAQLLAAGDAEGNTRIWNATSRNLCSTFTSHTSAVVSLTFSPNGKFLASHGATAHLWIWNVESGKEISGFPGDCIEIGSFAFSPCSTLIAADTEKEILVWDILRAETKHTFQKPAAWIDNGYQQTSLAFSANGRYLASGACENSGMANVPVHLWSLETLEKLVSFEGHTRGISALTFSPDDTVLASGSDDGTILLWDVKSYLSYENP